MDMEWLEKSVVGHPGIENPFLAYLDHEARDLPHALSLVRYWGEQEMPISLALSTRWLPTVLSRIWQRAFFDLPPPSKIPLSFESLILQSHGLIQNMAEEFGEREPNKAHPMLLYKLLSHLKTDRDTWTANPETDDLVKTGTAICERGSLAECVGYLWGAEKFAELEFSRILAALQRLGAPDELLIYWKVNVGADQEHSESLARLVDAYVSSSAIEHKRIVDAALTFFRGKESFFSALARDAGLTAQITQKSSQATS